MRETLSLMEQAEVGRKLQRLVNLEEWSVALTLLDQEVARAEFELMDYEYSDQETIVAKHRKARAMRQLHDFFIDEINQYIEAYENYIPEEELNGRESKE